MPNIEQFLALEKWTQSDVEALLKISNNTEGQQLEFKPQRELDYDETIAAFTYSNSGLILIGVDDDTGQIRGASDSVDSISRSINDRLHPHPVDLNIFEVNLTNTTGKVFVIRVIKDGVVCAAQNRFYKRIHEEDLPLTPEESRAVISFNDPTQADFSRKPFRAAELETCLDRDKVEAFLKLFKEKTGRRDVVPTPEFLEHTCKVIATVERKKILNAAGVLFFAKNPQSFIPCAKIRCILYMGSATNATIADELECEGNLMEMIEAAIEFIRKNVRKRGKVVGAKTEYEFEYPQLAFREAVINAVAHRDYCIGNQDIKVFIFSDRIEISSPGKFPINSMQNGLPLNHAPRNFIVADLLQRCEYGDRVGGGVNKIFVAMKELQRRLPEFSDTTGTAIVTLWGINADLQILMKKYGLITEEQNVMETALMQGYIQVNQAAELLHCGVPKARKLLNKLVKLQLIKPVGRGRAAKYRVPKNLSFS